MGKITFLTNWNKKLNHKKFITMRTSDRFNVEEEVEVFMKKKKIFNAVVEKKEQIELKDIDCKTAKKETGFSLETTKRILLKSFPGLNWNRDQIFIYTLKKI